MKTLILALVLAVVPSLVATPASLSPQAIKAMSQLEKVIALNCVTEAVKLCGKECEILQYRFIRNNPERHNVSYPYTVLILVRFDDPYGKLQRVLHWAVMADGTAMLLTPANSLYRDAY